MFNYAILPEHMRDGARLYIENGIPPGGFMRAIMANDFLYAAGKADHINIESFKDWAIFIYNEAPRECHGSYEVVDAWCKMGGLNGQTSAAEHTEESE